MGFSFTELFYRVVSLFLGFFSILLIAFSLYSSKWVIAPASEYYTVEWGPLQFCTNHPTLFNQDTVNFGYTCTGFDLSSSPHGTWTASVIILLIEGIVVIVGTFSILLSTCCPSGSTDKSNILTALFAFILNLFVVILFPISWGSGSYTEGGVTVVVCPDSPGSYRLGSCTIGSGYIATCLIFIPLVLMALFTGFAKQHAEKAYLKTAKENVNRFSASSSASMGKSQQL